MFSWKAAKHLDRRTKKVFFEGLPYIIENEYFTFHHLDVSVWLSVESASVN